MPRRSYHEQRIADAEDAAANGHGWTHLAQKWNMSRPGAFMWCRTHVTPSTVTQIGNNGRDDYMRRVFKGDLRAEIVRLRDVEKLTFQRIALRLNANLWRVHTLYQEQKAMAHDKPNRNTHNVRSIFSSTPKVYHECQHRSLIAGQLVQCGAPTKGKPTCPECKQRESVGTGQHRRDSIVTYVR